MDRLEEKDIQLADQTSELGSLEHSYSQTFRKLADVHTSFNEVLAINGEWLAHCQDLSARVDELQKMEEVVHSFGAWNKRLERDIQKK